MTTDTSRPTVEALIAEMGEWIGHPVNLQRDLALTAVGEVLGALLTERDDALRNYLRASRERDVAQAQIAEDAATVWSGNRAFAAETVLDAAEPSSHFECNCVPNLGPSHCHGCSEESGNPVAWDDRMCRAPEQYDAEEAQK